MILPFSLELNDQPTFFVEKITQCLSNYAPTRNLMMAYKWPKNNYYSHNWSARADFKDKLHTMRTDIKNRWQPGKLINFVVNNRTKKFWQFAPVIPCVSTQTINIIHTTERILILIDSKPYVEYFKYKEYLEVSKTIGRLKTLAEKDSETIAKLKTLAENDGFETLDQFLEYFSSDFHGKIIHWTNFRY